MIYIVELEVDEFGRLEGGEELLSMDGIPDWSLPHPAVPALLPFEWKEGEARTKPNAFWYPQLYDWACDEPAYDLLRRLAPADLHTVARGRLSSQDLFVVQAIGTAQNAVDRDASIVDKYSTYEIMRFPAFYRKKDEELSERVFRIPEMYPEVFMGATIKDELEAANIKGFRFVSVDWAD